MSSVHPAVDLIVRNGLIVDGTGNEAVEADISVHDGKILEVGKVNSTGKEEIDARGCIVTPGFVDIHTHYDGHVMWENHIRPSSAHGVTTVVTGNCGVGFAPCRPGDRGALLNLMEGIEDIPEPVMSAGLRWNWQSFPEFLDAVGERHFDLDVAMQLPHAPLRVFVMGQRAIDREPATPADITAMRALAREAVEAGAIGFSTTRAINHRGTDGKLSPSYTAAEDELVGIAMGLSDANGGVFQIISDFDEAEQEFDMIERIARNSRRPLSLSLIQKRNAPDLWKYTLGRIERANQERLEIRGQVACRPTGGLWGLDLGRHAFMFCPSYQAIADKPLGERVRAMRDPALRAALCGEFPTIIEGNMLSYALAALDQTYELAAIEPDYEPKMSDSIAAVAAHRNVDPVNYMYDRLLDDDGKTIFYQPASGFADNSIAPIAAMMAHPNTVHGLGDGGAHCSIICDASQQTYMLTRWARGRHGRSLPLARVIRMITQDTAAAVGLHDRGVLKPGYKADLNVIDFDRLALHRPEVTHDLPAAGTRLTQRATGYRATVAGGVITRVDGVPTGQLPGRLVRGHRVAPKAR